MLRPDEDALAVMKWRLERMPATNRWQPVLQRYVAYLIARIEGLGGDPNAVPASPDGAPVDAGGTQDVVTFTGKVVEVIYDCFGHFDGFVLAECCGNKTFASRARAIAELALRACKDDLLLTVFVSRRDEGCVRKLVIRC